ncbi:MAG: SusF/SusE family outer membrane protein [Bacteroidales bacterium]|nr:SusF/SusE family outer membrane protein [Bacteroidales bacterium]
MKITKYFLSMAAAAAMVAGCYKPEMNQIAAPEDVVAPVLEAVEGPIEITPSNMVDGVVAFTWSAADYGVPTQINYSLEAATAAAPETMVTITSGITSTSTEVDYETLNAILFNDLKLADGVAEDVNFCIGVKVGEYAKIYSNVVTVSCKVTAAEKTYPTLTVAGSYAYNNWTPGKGQFVFDFDGTDTKYSGVIDFGEDVSALQFKFVGTAWGQNEFSVPAGAEQAAEAAELPLVAGGGDNIAAYTTHRYYSLTLDKATPKVIKNFSFNSLGVIGDATSTGWDADTDMQFNADKQRFYVDITLIDGTIKFRADDAWDVNWGGADGVLASGADNIPVTAGDYRIYVNLNDPANPTYELNASMFGKDEPTSGGTTEPEPPVDEPVQLVGWGIVGAFSGWADGADVMLASDGTFLVAKGVALEGEFKFRKDGAWGTNFGAAEGAAFAANTEVALAPDGANLVAEAGTYDVYLDEVNGKAWFITDGSYPGGGAAPEASEWGIVGVVNGWNAPDITMYKTATEGLFVAYNVAMPDGGFKIRANGQWVDTANYGLEKAGAVEVDHVYDLVCGGGSGDMTLAAGNYDIWFDLTNSKVYIMTPGKPISEAVGGEVVTPEPEPEPEVTAWFLVGNFNGWTVGDANYQFSKEGDWYVFKGFTADGQGVKLNAGSWEVNRGGEFVAANEAIAIAQDGSDMFVAAGTYDVYMNADATELYFMEEGKSPVAPEPEQTWYLVGNFNGWATGDANYQFTKEGDWYVFKGFTADGQGVKFNAGSWDDNRGGTFVAANEAIAVAHNGSDILVAAGTYDVYMNAATDTAYFMEVGKTPAN